MKSLLKCVLVVILIIILPTPTLDGLAQGAETAPVAAELLAPEATGETDATEAPEAAPTAPAEPEATAAPTETIAPEAGLDPASAEYLLSLLPPDRCARIRASWESEHLGVGDEITLTAVISGYGSVAYELLWQSSENGVDWTDRARGGDRFSFTLTKDNYLWMWRVVVVIYAPAQK